MAADRRIFNGPVSHQSRLNVIKFTYRWKIERCVDLIDRRQFEIESEEFSPNSAAGGKWKLMLFMSENRELSTSDLSAKLIKMSDDGKPFSVKFTISIVFNNLSNVRAEGEKVFRYFSDSEECYFFLNDFSFKQKLQKFQDLTIICMLDILLVDNLVQEPTRPASTTEYQARKNNLSGPSSAMDMDYDSNEKTNNTDNISVDKNDSPSNIVEDSLKALCSDFEAMYLKRQFTDVNIIVEGKPFAAHRAVLAARSNFFNDISGAGNIIVTGVKSIVMESVLYYIYTGKTHCLNPDSALDLLHAAMKFNLIPLEKLTLEFLKSNISVMNALEILEVADEKSLDDLKSTCLKFISYNHSEFEQTEKWQRILKKNPHVAGQVLLAVASVQAPNII